MRARSSPSLGVAAAGRFYWSWISLERPREAPVSRLGPGLRCVAGLPCAMAGFGLQHRAVQLLGRERECAVIDRVLENANRGVSDALVVRGEAGIGKSALLEYA